MGIDQARHGEMVAVIDHRLAPSGLGRLGGRADVRDAALVIDDDGLAGPFLGLEAGP